MQPPVPSLTTYITYRDYCKGYGVVYAQALAPYISFGLLALSLVSFGAALVQIAQHATDKYTVLFFVVFICFGFLSCLLNPFFLARLVVARRKKLGLLHTNEPITCCFEADGIAQYAPEGLLTFIGYHAISQVRIVHGQVLITVGAKSLYFFCSLSFFESMEAAQATVQFLEQAAYHAAEQNRTLSPLETPCLWRLHYTLVPAQYAEILKRKQFPQKQASPKTTMILVCIIIIFFIPVVLFGIGNLIFKGLMLSALLIVLCIFAFGFYLNKVNNPEKQSQVFCGPTVLQIDENGITVGNPYMRNKYNWGQISGVIGWPDCVSIWQDSSLLTMIPAQAVLPETLMAAMNFVHLHAALPPLPGRGQQAGA